MDSGGIARYHWHHRVPHNTTHSAVASLYLGPFETPTAWPPTLFLPNLSKNPLPACFSTRAHSVVCLSSVMHHTGCADWNSSAFGHPNRHGSTYADSKLAMVLFAKVS